MNQKTRDEADMKMPKIVKSDLAGSVRQANHDLVDGEESGDYTHRYVLMRCWQRAHRNKGLLVAMRLVFWFLPWRRSRTPPNSWLGCGREYSSCSCDCPPFHRDGT